MSASLASTKTSFISTTRQLTITLLSARYCRCLMSLDLDVPLPLKSKLETRVQFFDDNGRRVPGKDERLFGSTPSFYYQLKQPAIDYECLLERSKRFNFVPE